MNSTVSSTSFFFLFFFGVGQHNPPVTLDIMKATKIFGHLNHAFTVKKDSTRSSTCHKRKFVRFKVAKQWTWCWKWRHKVSWNSEPFIVNVINYTCGYTAKTFVWTKSFTHTSTTRPVGLVHHFFLVATSHDILLCNDTCTF